MSELSPGNQKSRTAAPRLLFESGSPGRSGFYWPEEDGKAQGTIPTALLRNEISGFPELGELEVLRLLAAGKSNQTMASELVVSLGTVKKHLHNIFGKLSVQSRTECVARARELRLL